ncbi:MAG: MFS transporter [Liquorilactobacillus nagelii]|uniref:MFS transporter n=1 Tax=Liquorilactobacillus nagelii TaxID=82688 RepID=UPI0039E79AC2
MEHQRKKREIIIGFVLFMGLVNFFADMTHEGARSIYGSYLGLLGMNAAKIGFITGFGEFVGYALRFWSGRYTDRSKKYWLIALIGFSINMAAIPALVLVNKNGWLLASFFIVAERMGRALRLPANNTMLSFAGMEVGEGKAFAIEEFLDSVGAFIGPVYLYLIMLFKPVVSVNDYRLLFGALALPAIITLIVLGKAYKKFPQPEKFASKPQFKSLNQPNKALLVYALGISMFALGFIDFPIITMHIAQLGLVSTADLPLLYAYSMLIGAFSTLIFGYLYDWLGLKTLVIPALLSAGFSYFVFGNRSLGLIMLGITLWGIGMGAQESLMESVIGTIVPSENRAFGFGIFDMIFGIFWFLGSWISGVLYDHSITLMIVFSIGTQLLAIPCYLFVAWKNKI